MHSHQSDGLLHTFILHTMDSLSRRDATAVRDDAGLYETDHESNMTHTSPATTKHPTKTVIMTGIVFHLMNSRGVTKRPFWSRILRQSRPAREAENLSRGDQHLHCEVG